MSIVNGILSYLEMCGREKISLQRGMSFGLAGNHSVILMALPPHVLRDERLSEDGTGLIYEGHDAMRAFGVRDPKTVDQPEIALNGRLTQNGLFHRAATAFKAGKRPPERVRVYEKLRQGIWSDGGIFLLTDSWRAQSGQRSAFKFSLVAVEGEENFGVPVASEPRLRPVMPIPVKVAAWKRDRGRCALCGATDGLRFGLVAPVLRGDVAMGAENVQVVCHPCCPLAGDPS